MLPAEDESSVGEKNEDTLSLEVVLTSNVNSRNDPVPILEEVEGNIFSSEEETSTLSETQVSEPAASSRDYDKDEVELGGKFELPSKESPSAARYQPQTTDAASSDSVKTDVLPPFVSSISETTIPRDEREGKDETTTHLEADRGESSPTVENAGPPPLAGANVMNVALVAAECAHWIKTGTCMELLSRKLFLLM